MAQKHYSPPQTIAEAFQNRRYHGKIVIESPEGLHSTTKSTTAIREYKKLSKKYASEKLITTVIPKVTTR